MTNRLKFTVSGTTPDTGILPLFRQSAIGLSDKLVLLLLFFILLAIPATKQLSDKLIINGVAIPADFPVVNHVRHDPTAPGKLFLTNYVGAPYLLILENDGTPYYYRRLDHLATLFAKHSNGLLSRGIREGNRIAGFEFMDSNYRVVDTVTAIGYECDVHEVLITQEGHYLLIAREEKRMDMSQVVTGGNTDALVIGNHIQELDQDKNLVFEWRSWDHYDVRDAQNIDLTGQLIDYVHMNSIAVDYDGQLVVSSRYLNECTKIDRQTGKIIWRLGGANNQFGFINDSLQLAWQHDIRPVPGKPNHYTIFDNGNHRDEKESRVLEYAVDPDRNTVTKVWEYCHPEHLFSFAMGNAQRLGNGNTLINYAMNELPKALEVTREGEIVYEADYERSNLCYRTYRHEWEGRLTEPYLLVDRYPDVIRLVFNQFGDKNVSYYKIYGGRERDNLDIIDSTKHTWLELNKMAGSGWFYFRVTSVDGSGAESGYSNIDSTVIHYVADGENLIINGEFLAGTDFWDLETREGAGASGRIADGWYEVTVHDGGTTTGHARLFQNMIPLEEGGEYTLQFEAYGDTTRIIEPALERVSYYPPEDYSKLDSLYVSGIKEVFSCSFRMGQPTDLRSMLVFDLGGAEGRVFIGNVSLRKEKKTGS